MDFSPRRVDGSQVMVHDSGLESDLQPVFVPGPWNVELWKHQVKYFSKCFRTVAIDPQGKELEKQARAVESVIDRLDLKNAVLIVQSPAETIFDRLEYSENIVATVKTGGRFSRMPPRKVFDVFWRLCLGEPKIFKKIFLSRMTDYRVAEDLTEELEKPDYDTYRSFLTGQNRRPVKNSLSIASSEDRFTSLDRMRPGEPGESVSVIEGAGSFPSFEKPQEYNKALLDFFNGLENFVESREVSRIQETNRSLKEFEARRAEIER